MSHADALAELFLHWVVHLVPDLVDTFISLVGDGSGPLLSGRLSVIAGRREGKARTGGKATNGAKSAQATGAVKVPNLLKPARANAAKATNGTAPSNGSSSTKRTHPRTATTVKGAHPTDLSGESAPPSGSTRKRLQPGTQVTR
jgi:hypothetical protein